MSNNVSILATATVAPEVLVLAWREAKLAEARAWAKVARVHRRISKLYTLREASRSVEFVGGAMPSNDREEAFDASMAAVSAEIQSLEALASVLRTDANSAVATAAAAWEATI
jgi:inorganic triphosphatase YgiF